MGTEFAEPEHLPKAVPQHYEGQQEWGKPQKKQPRNAFTHQGPRFDDPMPSSFPSYKRTDGTPEGAERLRQEFLADPELSWLVDRSLKKPTHYEAGLMRREKREREAGQKQAVLKPPELVAQNSQFVYLPADVHQQVFTQKPMNSAAQLEAATIQQMYGFENAGFARWLVDCRLKEEAIRTAWVKENLGPNPRQDLPVGHNVGHFESGTPLNEPHQTGQGRFYYNVTLAGAADAYYRQIMPEAKRLWMAEVARQQKIRQQQAAQQQAVQPPVQTLPSAPKSQGKVLPKDGAAGLPPIPFDHQYVVSTDTPSADGVAGLAPIPFGREPVVVNGSPDNGGSAALTPERRFEANLARNALGLLQSNKDRLNSEQTQYAQDKDPNSPRWSHLWQAASQKREFQRQQANLEQQRDLVSQQLNELSDIPDANTGSMTATAADVLSSPKHKQLVALQAQQNRLQERITFSKQMQVSLEYAYPALAAVQGETGKDPGDLQAVQARIPGAFDGMRGDIDKLGGAIQKDPSTAVLLDSVVAAQLQDKSMSPKDREAVMGWLKSEREGKENVQKIGALVSGGLFVGSFVPQLKGVAGLLRVLAGVGGGAVAMSELPDLMMLDAAAQAGYGGDRLTSQSPEQARFNLVMGYANVALAGMDIGMNVHAVQALARIPGAVSGLSREQGRVLMLSLGQIKGEVTDAIVQKMANAVKRADELTSTTIVNADGTLTQSRPLGQMADKLDAKVAARASGKAKKPKDMTPAERLAHAKKNYGQASNWDEIEPLIGTAVNKNTKLPPGYVFYEKPVKRGPRPLFILRENANDASFAPLMVEGGKIQVGKARLSRGLDAMKANLKAMGVDVPQGYQLNHLVPDTVTQSDPLMFEMLQRNLYDVDRASNLLPMPGDVRAAHPDLIGHYGSHENYSNLVRQELKQEKDLLIDKYGSLNKVPDKELQEAVRDIENNMREGIVNRSLEIPTRYDPGTGTRILSEGISDPDFVA